MKWRRTGRLDGAGRGVRNFKPTKLTGTRRKEVVNQGLSHRHAGAKEDGKVAQLVRQFFAHDGQRDADARRDRLVEGGAQRQAVDEIVESVAKDDHPGQRGDRRVSALVVDHVLVAVTPLRFLQ